MSDLSPRLSGSGHAALEPAHGLVSALDAAMILLNPVVELALGPKARTFTEFGPDRHHSRAK
jgi:hypothetical protein